MADNVMLDLETLGKKPYCPVLAIGACMFDGNDYVGTLTGTENAFYQAITLESCMEIGLKPDASTILWWMAQSKEAQAVFNDPAAVALPIALDAYTDWLNSRPHTVWGNSARFDCGILEAAYLACGKEVPWNHWDESCYRTDKKKAPGIKLERFGTYHNALDDAVSQARHLQKIYLHLGLSL